MNLKKMLKENENRAFAFGLGSVLWVTIIMNIPYWIAIYQKSVSGAERSFSPWMGFALALTGVALAIIGLVFGIKGYKKSARSGKLWVGIVASAAVITLALLFFIGEFIFPH